jgi:hypothetical protein
MMAAGVEDVEEVVAPLDARDKLATAVLFFLRGF